MIHVYNARFEQVAQTWESPTVIISDGAYGIGGFDGDTNKTSDLPSWYRNHVDIWSKAAMRTTTLWFWNTEVGWANVHPLLETNGWVYVHSNTCDKGKSHIAGNVNTNTIRHFPVATEVCVQYVREEVYHDKSTGKMHIQDWLRREWKRAGLTLKQANEACGVKNVASRKYLTSDHLWYMPPPDMMARLVGYANQHGKTEGKPYFVLDDEIVTASKWQRVRAIFNCPYGVYNVWHEKPVRGKERVRGANGKYLHPNQKPLTLMERVITASSNPGDVIWDVYGGVMTGAVAAKNTGRTCYTSEPDSEYYKAGLARLRSV